MATNMMTSLSRSAHKVGFQIKKHSPEILIVAGIVGTVASAVMACKATTKVSTLLENTKKNIDDVHACLEDPNVDYTEEDSKKDLTIIYTQTGWEFVKLYGPAIALGALSLTGIVASNNILRKRNIALAAAYATVDRGFKEYRNRVIDRFGRELDRELRYNIKAKEIETTTTDENGNEKTVKETVETACIDKNSDFARFFDESCFGWSKDAEHNLFFLKQQQAHANDLLQKQGYLYLNDVYKMLGMEQTKAGQAVGWIYNEQHPVGDNFVDFGLYDDERNPRVRAFINGHERNVLLDFNVDGNIWELMD